MKAERFPVAVTQGGVSAKIRKVSKIKNGKNYIFYVADYFLLGKRKQEWRSKFSDAKQVALTACRKIANGEQISLILTNTERMAYLRANEVLTPVGVQLDVAAHEYASATMLLCGRATLTEVCRDWLKRHAVELPRVSIKKAADEIVRQAEVNGRSIVRVRQTMPERPHLQALDIVSDFDAMSAYVAKLQSLVNLTTASVARAETTATVPAAASVAAEAGGAGGQEKVKWNPDAEILKARGVKSQEELNSKNFVVPD